MKLFSNKLNKRYLCVRKIMLHFNVLRSNFREINEKLNNNRSIT